MSDQRGFTLLGALVSFGMVTLFAMGTMSFQLNTKREIQKQENLALRNSEYTQFYRLLSQPSYIGALANSTVNAQLGKCIRNDGVICSSTEDYPLTALDLATGQPTETLSSDASASVTSRLSFRVHCPSNAPTCDAADYLIIKIKSSTKTASGTSFETEKVLSVKPKASQTADFIPNTSLEPGRPVNLILFLDGSGSLLFIKDSIKTALQNLLTKISTMDVNLTLLEVQFGSDFRIEKRYYIDSNSGLEVPITPMEEQQFHLTKPPGFTWFELRAVYPRYGMSYPNAPIGYASRVAFSSQDSAIDRQAKITALWGTIDMAFTRGAVFSNSMRDSSLCTLLRVLNDPNPPLKIDATTPTVVMMIANENEESVLPLTLAETDQTTPFFGDWSAVCVKDHLTQKVLQKPPVWWYTWGASYRPGVAVSTNFIV
ncbi:MAG: hypothetical protein NDJ90_11985, partial [Oligoflexia bacterium]|nr:hypothetical protein [Oligoflexia bacterium]